ncbi:MAG TPA: DUF72 domain-containing protein [Burkholderiaceae bacterium]|nr:DUF72 domain-containing protein [Burkholderiaceae bacterium]
MQQNLLDEPDPGPVGPRRNIVVGTCSWTDPSLIKSKRFYPRGCSSAEDRLRYYAAQFPIVEVDSSYFAFPDPANSQRWVERTPNEFRFNIKAYRLFTGHHTPPESLPADIQQALPALPEGKRNWHYADMPEELRDELWRRFLQAVAPLHEGGKLTAVHFQFAPWVTNARQWRDHVEECVRRMNGHLLAVEFRNQTWFGDERRVERTLDWERGLGVVHVIVDEPQGVGNYAQGVWAVTSPQLAVVRLHGRNAGTWNAKGLKSSSERFNYEYTDEELGELAGRCRSVADEAVALQVLVNVNYEDQGVRAARRLIEMLQLPY